MIAPCGMYKVENTGASWDVYPVIGISLSKNVQFSVNSPAAVDASLGQHCGIAFQWVKLTPSAWVLYSVANSAAHMHSEPKRDAPSAVPTELVSLVSDSVDEIDEDVEEFDLFG